MARTIWTREAIVADLRKLKKAGARPTPFELKGKYGFENNSEFFPLLDSVGAEVPELKGFVERAFSLVTNPLDLNFRFGSCTCRRCTKNDWLG